MPRKKAKLQVEQGDDGLYRAAVPGQPYNVMASDSVKALVEDMEALTGKRFEPEVAADD